MPFIGEQPKLAGTLTVTARSGNVEVDITTGVVTITARSGTVEIGVT
tara:strand:- start:365 stop:505 length:141 start_codon:yes stop_codon:yes gene_type:complete